MNWIEIDSFAMPPFVWKLLKEEFFIFDAVHSMWGPDCFWCAYLQEYYGWSRIACMLDPSSVLVHENWASFTSKETYEQRQRKGEFMKRKYEQSEAKGL